MSVSEMIAEAIRRREEIAAQEEAARAAQQARRDGSLPPANNLFGDPLGEDVGIQGEGDDSQDYRPVPRRRGRSPSWDDDTPEARGRKYARFAEEECDRFALRGSRRSLVQKFATVSCQSFLSGNVPNLFSDGSPRDDHFPHGVSSAP